MGPVRTLMDGMGTTTDGIAVGVARGVGVARTIGLLKMMPKYMVAAQTTSIASMMIPRRIIYRLKCRS